VSHPRRIGVPGTPFIGSKRPLGDMTEKRRLTGSKRLTEPPSPRGSVPSNSVQSPRWPAPSPSLRVEAGRDAERAGADALRDRIAALQAQLAAAEQAAEQARRQAQAAQDNAAETLRGGGCRAEGQGPSGAVQGSVAGGIANAGR
jgi:hypothetical protein